MALYIDADVLRLDVLNHANRQHCEGNNDKEEAFIRCLYLIDCMPPADVRPNTHGSWNPGGDFPVRCSNCGRGSVQPENFCMSCGADMRGGNV